MQLDDLTPLARYNEEQSTTYKETLATALAGKIDLYYVFDGRGLVIYEPIDDLHKGNGTKDNLIGGPDDIEIEYLPADFLKLPEVILRELWGHITYDHYKVTLGHLIFEHEPAGFKLAKMLDGSERAITADHLYVHSAPLSAPAKDNNKHKPSNTELKVIGLLMHHLAKSPKYASGTSPNKSQIKELLLELAVELDVNNYGLSKVDERLLAEAMKYLETQKN